MKTSSPSPARAAVLLSLSILLSLASIGCRDKVAECKKTCADLEKEHTAKCVGPGADSCKLAVTRSRGLGRLFADAFADRPALIDKSGNLTIKISGCPNGCGLHHVAGLGFQGGLRKVDGKAVPQYFVLAGGGVEGERVHFGKVVAKVPARRMAEVVERLVLRYDAEHHDGEAMAAFLRRVMPTLKASLADLEALDEQSATADDYIDLGDTTAFVPEVGEGECAV